MAILAVPYAVLQPDSLDDPGSSIPTPEKSKDGEPMDKAIELDETTSALGPLVLKCVLTVSLFMNSAGDLGVGGLFIGVVDDEDLPRK